MNRASGCKLKNSNRCHDHFHFVRKIIVKSTENKLLEIKYLKQGQVNHHVRRVNRGTNALLTKQPTDQPTIFIS